MLTPSESKRREHDTLMRLAESFPVTRLAPCKQRIVNGRANTADHAGLPARIYFTTGR